MRKGDKRWVAVGLLVVVTGAGAALLRNHVAEHGDRRAAADAPLRAPEAPPPQAPTVQPETPEAIAAEVGRTLSAWRQAILTRDAEAVVRIDRAFLSSPDRYRATLEISAKTEADERVRAFSTRVLGKLRNPALAALFEALLADESPFVRQNAAWALGELADREDGRTAARRAVADLRRARAKDPAEDVRTAAKGALARLE
jgi:HEAT repeat protein